MFTKESTIEEVRAILGVYLEAVDDCKWLSPQHIKRARSMMNKGQFSFWNYRFKPVAAEFRKMIINVQDQEAIALANRIVGVEDNSAIDEGQQKRRTEIYFHLRETNVFSKNDVQRVLKKLPKSLTTN